MSTSAEPAHQRDAVKKAASGDFPMMTHLPQMQQNFQPPLIANENAYLGDVVSSQIRDAQKPGASIFLIFSFKTKPSEVTSGFFRLQPGTPLIYTYTYHEMKIILEGDYTITDVTTLSEEQREGKTSAIEGVKSVKAKPGISCVVRIKVAQHGLEECQGCACREA